MKGISFYFQVHQPFRLRKDFNFFSIGPDGRYEDDKSNAEILKKVANNCYLPTNQVLLNLIERHQGKFKIAFSISGTALEQFELYAPDVLESFKKLAKTGCVEFLAETYYHSLASLFSESEFRMQVALHSKKIEQLFGQTPTTFRNTELIYNNHIAKIVESMGYRAIVAEGADRVLDWRSPNYVYHPLGAPNVSLLLKNYKLSDDVAFRFSNRGWDGWPLLAGKFAKDLHLSVQGKHFVGLFMDYETFGEHQWRDTGIFDFLDALPGEILKYSDMGFMTPTEVAKAYSPISELDIHGLVSWADLERDVSAWLGNPLQDSAAQYVFGMEKQVLATHNEELIHAWRKLQTSDHFYYMCIKYHNDGDVHKYFNPYETPYDAFIHYINALHQLRWYLGQLSENSKTDSAGESSKEKASERKTTKTTTTTKVDDKEKVLAGEKTKANPSAKKEVTKKEVTKKMPNKKMSDAKSVDRYILN